MAKGIYLVAIIPNGIKTEPPNVATPLGPYGLDEARAMESAMEWLKDTYGTENIRTVESYSVDFMDVHAQMVRLVAAEHTKALEVEALRAETCAWLDGVGLDVTDMELDQILEALGVNPGDV